MSPYGSSQTPVRALILMSYTPGARNTSRSMLPYGVLCIQPAIRYGI